MIDEQELVIEQTLVKAEEVASSKERTTEQVEEVVNSVYNLLQNKIPEEFDRCLKNNDEYRVSPEQIIDVANTQGIFARAMNIMRMQQHYDQHEVHNLVWGRGNDSVVSKLTTHGRSREFALRHLQGAMGNITFYDVLRKSFPKVASELRLSEIIAPAEDDVKFKSDIVARWTGDDGKERIRVVQLKVDKTPVITIDEITKDRPSSSTMGVDAFKGKKMLEYVAHLKRQNPGAEVKAFVMGLPSIETGESVVNLTYGTINHKSMQGAELIEAARQELFRTKFI